MLVVARFLLCGVDCWRLFVVCSFFFFCLWRLEKLEKEGKAQEQVRAHYFWVTYLFRNINATLITNNLSNNLSMPDDVTNDTRVAAQADAIVLAVPFLANAQYTRRPTAHEAKHVVVVMPARSGCLQVQRLASQLACAVGATGGTAEEAVPPKQDSGNLFAGVLGPLLATKRARAGVTFTIKASPTRLRRPLHLAGEGKGGEAALWTCCTC